MPKGVGVVSVVTALLAVVFGAAFFAPTKEPDIPFVPVATESAAAPPSAAADAFTTVSLQEKDGTLTVPVTINQSLKLHFILDSGASDVIIPEDVVATMIRSGTLTKSDFTGRQSYKIADGTIVPSCTFTIKNLNVGGISVNDVQGAVSSKKGDLLLGQSFLSRISSWSIDNNDRILKLGPVKPAPHESSMRSEAQELDTPSDALSPPDEDCGIE